MRREWVYKGWLQVYVTGERYKMHMESVAQIVDISGNWTYKGNKIYLTAKDIVFDDRGGELQRPEGVLPLPPEEVRETYSHGMVLSLQPGKTKLVSLDMTLGPLVGTHVFTKGGE